MANRRVINARPSVKEHRVIVPREKEREDELHGGCTTVVSVHIYRRKSDRERERERMLCRWRLSAEFIARFPTMLQGFKPALFDIK